MVKISDYLKEELIKVNLKTTEKHEAIKELARVMQNAQEITDYEKFLEHDMDAVIQNFLNFAEFSPADLLSIIKLDSIDENHGYIGHLNTIAKGFEHGQKSGSGRRSDHSKLIE